MESDLHRFAYKLTSDRDSANDLVQDCVLQALDNHEKFTHAKNLKGWMFTIMRNIFVNNYRRTVREMNLKDTPCTHRPQAIYCTTPTHRKKHQGASQTCASATSTG